RGIRLCRTRRRRRSRAAARLLGSALWMGATAPSGTKGPERVSAVRPWNAEDQPTISSTVRRRAHGAPAPAGIAGVALVVAALLPGCAGSGSVGPMPGSPADDAPDAAVLEPDFSTLGPPPGKDVTEWGCEEEWLTQASVD